MWCQRRNYGGYPFCVLDCFGSGMNICNCIGSAGERERERRGWGRNWYCGVDWFGWRNLWNWNHVSSCRQKITRFNLWMMFFLGQFKGYMAIYSWIPGWKRTFRHVHHCSPYQTNLVETNIQCPEKDAFKAKHVKVYGTKEWGQFFLGMIFVVFWSHQVLGC